MNRFRITLAQLMLVVLYSAFGMAALRNANGFWASATFGVAIVSVAVALAIAVARSDRERISWAAFGIAGGARLLIWLTTPEVVGFLNGPPRPLLHQFQASINPAASGGTVYIAYTQICNSLDVIILGLFAAVIGQFVGTRSDRPSR